MVHSVIYLVFGQNDDVGISFVVGTMEFSAPAHRPVAEFGMEISVANQFGKYFVNGNFGAFRIDTDRNFWVKNIVFQ